jgi:hypothetical protein
MVEPVDDTQLGANADWSRSPVLSRIRRAQGRVHHPRKTIVLVVTLLVAAVWAVSSSGGGPTARVSSSWSGVATVDKIDAMLTRHSTTTTTSVVPPVTTTTSTTAVTSPAKALPVAVVPVAPAVAPPIAPTVAPAAPAVAPAVAEPSVAALVGEVEAAGIEPGSNWSWSMGDTATHCAAMTGAGTGCTYGSNGLEYSVFSGSPTLALVAHELANAETQNDAVPDLLSQVAADAGGTAWSPTDAVASCLVAHFMGFQDDSAGTWQCSAALATTVAANIHDSL